MSNSYRIRIQAGDEDAIQEFSPLFKGFMRSGTGQTSEAVERFKEALRSRPPSWNIDAFDDCLANAYLRLGRFDEALAEYERIPQLNPNYPLPRYHLAQAYEGKNMHGLARDSYTEFLQIWKKPTPIFLK